MIKKFLIFVFLILVYVAMSPYACAEIITVEGEGSYTMGGGLEESPTAARAEAFNRAKGNAAEKAGIYVEKK